MSERRLLLWLRLLTGVGFLYQGSAHILDKFGQADLFAAHTAWQSWPLVGGMRPLELTLWLALIEFGLGVFLFGGLLTRILGALGAMQRRSIERERERDAERARQKAARAAHEAAGAARER